jgi:hypothetical protein
MKPLSLIVTLGVILFLAACNMPGAQPQPTPGLPLEQQAGTMVAATLQAAATAKPTGVTPFASPVPAVVTPTNKPVFTVNAANAECRSGPSGDFSLIATFAAGTKVDLAGKDTADSYYIVVDPTSHNLCWIQAQDGTPGGSFSNLLEVTPPAGTGTTGQKVPARPSFVSYSFQCEFATGGIQVKVDLTWPDSATNEKGYRVYRNGNQVADLPANSTSYSETTNISSGTTYVYGVAAYNDIGASDQATTRGDPITCQ